MHNQLEVLLSSVAKITKEELKPTQEGLNEMDRGNDKSGSEILLIMKGTPTSLK